MNEAVGSFDDRESWIGDPLPLAVSAVVWGSCHGFRSAPGQALAAAPREELDDQVLQLAWREVLQDVVFDIRKWIARIGFGPVFGILQVAMLGALRLADVLEDMVSDRVQVPTDPLLKTGDTQLKETDEVQDSVRLAQYRIAQFDQLHQKLDDTKEKVNKVKTARQSLESRAGELADHFEQLENRFVNANRKMRNDRECRLE